MRMPIRFHLNGQRFDSETIRVMGLAYEITLISLRLFDRDDIANDVVAHKIIEQANAGERDPERLCAAVVQQWGRAIAHIAPPMVQGEHWLHLSEVVCSQNAGTEAVFAGCRDTTGCGSA
jgi:hypothetical protein